MMKKHMQSMMDMMQMMHKKMKGQSMDSQIDMAEKHLNMMEMMMSDMDGHHSSMSKKH